MKTRITLEDFTRIWNEVETKQRDGEIRIHTPPAGTAKVDRALTFIDGERAVLEWPAVLDKSNHLTVRFDDRTIVVDDDTRFMDENEPRGDVDLGEIDETAFMAAPTLAELASPEAAHAELQVESGRLGAD